MKITFILCAAALLPKCLFDNENGSLALQVVRVTKCSFKFSKQQHAQKYKCSQAYSSNELDLTFV